MPCPALLIKLWGEEEMIAITLKLVTHEEQCAWHLWTKCLNGFQLQALPRCKRVCSYLDRFTKPDKPGRTWKSRCQRVSRWARWRRLGDGFEHSQCSKFHFALDTEKALRSFEPPETVAAPSVFSAINNWSVVCHSMQTCWCKGGLSWVETCMQTQIS